MSTDIIVFMLLPILAIFGAWFSKGIKLGNGAKSIIPMFITSMFSAVAWILISKYTKMSLAVATIVFDTVLGLAYFFAFMAFGEAVSLRQWIGVALAVIGTILMGK